MTRKPLTDAHVSTLIQRVMDGNARGLPTLAYGRVSTKKQTEGISLRGSCRIQRWADEHGLSIPQDGWDEEPGDSAWKGKRPVFQRLLADLPHWADRGVQIILVLSTRSICSQCPSLRPGHSQTTSFVW